MSLQQQLEYRAMKKLYDKVTKYIEQMQDEFMEEFDRRATEYIDDWYNEYPERKYKPKKSLYNVYKIKRINYGVNVEYNSDFLDSFKHHQPSEIIYHNVFELGYHGGSWGENNYEPYEGISVPEGEPHWRRRVPNMEGRMGFYDWNYNPVPKSQTPLYDLLTELEDEVFKKVDKKLYNRLKSAWNIFLNEVGW